MGVVEVWAFENGYGGSGNFLEPVDCGVEEGSWFVCGCAIVFDELKELANALNGEKVAKVAASEVSGSVDDG